jgi:hypothetical protein
VFDIDSLPAPQQISHKAIATAAQKLAEARAAADAAAKATVQAENQLDLAGDRDAEDEAQARRAGTASKTRRSSHRLAAEKALQDSVAEAKVTQILAREARGDLEALLQEVGESYRAEVDKLCVSLGASHRDAVASLIQLYGEYAKAVSIARKLGSERQGVQMIPLKARQIGHQNANFLAGTPAFVDVGEILGVMLELGHQGPVKPRAQNTPGPDVGRLVWEDTSASSPKVQAFFERAEARKRETAAAAGAG